MTYLSSLGTDSALQVDVVKAWSVMKAELAKKFGLYTKDGQTIVLNGRSYPVLTIDQGMALYKGWLAFGNSLQDAILSERPDIARQISLDTGKFLSREVDWYLGLDSFRIAGTTQRALYLNKYMFLASTRELLDDVIGKYVLDLSKNIWAFGNIEAPYQRMIASFKETTGGSLLVPLIQVGWEIAPVATAFASYMASLPSDIKDAAKASVSILDSLAGITKWGAIGGGLFMLYWYVLRPSKS